MIWELENFWIRDARLPLPCCPCSLRTTHREASIVCIVSAFNQIYWSHCNAEKNLDLLPVHPFTFYLKSAMYGHPNGTRTAANRHVDNKKKQQFLPSQIFALKECAINRFQCRTENRSVQCAELQRFANQNSYYLSCTFWHSPTLWSLFPVLIAFLSSSGKHWRTNLSLRFWKGFRL